MIKTILKEVKEYKAASIATPIYMILEVIFEMMIPLLMASIIDNGVNKGDMGHIYRTGVFMLVIALLGLFAGILGGRYGAKAATGLAKNLRETMFNHIQTFSFANIDKFSTAGLVTRLTTDVNNIQMAYRREPARCGYAQECGGVSADTSAAGASGLSAHLATTDGLCHRRSAAHHGAGVSADVGENQPHHRPSWGDRACVPPHVRNARCRPHRCKEFASHHGAL